MTITAKTIIGATTTIGVITTIGVGTTTAGATTTAAMKTTGATTTTIDTRIVAKMTTTRVGMSLIGTVVMITAMLQTIGVAKASTYNIIADPGTFISVTSP